MIMPPSRMAVVGDPGIPSVIIGSIEPVDAALLAASGAATPATLPLPNVSPSFENVLARPYDISEAGVAPAAGSVPTKKPKKDPHHRNRKVLFDLSKVGDYFFEADLDLVHLDLAFCVLNRPDHLRRCHRYRWPAPGTEYHAGIPPVRQRINRG